MVMCQNKRTIRRRNVLHSPHINLWILHGLLINKINITEQDIALQKVYGQKSFNVHSNVARNAALHTDLLSTIEQSYAVSI